jgi:hypothetical protein
MGREPAGRSLEHAFGGIVPGRFEMVDSRGKSALDAKKLDALREKYSDAKGGEIYQPDFAAVAAQVFTGAERRKWPFADPATFLGCRSGPTRCRKPPRSAPSRARLST